MSVQEMSTFEFVVPTVGDDDSVRALIATGEASESYGPGSAQGLALLILAAAALLSTDPRRKEAPVEDAYQGAVQNLACAQVF
ncbi:hypothetical protein [Kitasatospora viridis]|uniref:Uncharacterized protein n=1 Tax=Kitasatospora viridis TaxID=281105 RepID=A0A561UP07_9ACTN|nr:hypothetical protein [Kitasatospora viridis]TWG01097.1 hypothetical protein FHX73_114984 [Kitasatospora viridis]